MSLVVKRRCSQSETSESELKASVSSGNPESLEAATELGLLYLKTGDVQRAFQQFGTVLAHAPNCVNAILPIAYVIQAVNDGPRRARRERGISPIFTWSPDVRRYESYDLEKGPVFYEAYYPDDEPRTHYQEKRYYDREPVYEKTYQLPERAEKNYQDRPDGDFQNVDPFSPQPLNIKEISELARRAISRDLENWNTLEDYLDRAKYQNPPFPSRAETNSREPYEERREEPLALPGRLRSTRDQRFIEPDRNRFESVPYENREQLMQAVRMSPVNTLKNPVPANSLNSYPTENIFAPRPQVINYIFSKRPAENRGDLVASETKETKESIPRNYGDNLIRDEMKKKDENKNAKIASIEVSEVPRHKTRHHHGDWPKREYPHRHQS